MTNRIAFVIAASIGLAFLADIVLNHAHASMFLLRKLVDLIDLVAIWR